MTPPLFFVDALPAGDVVVLGGAEGATPPGCAGSAWGSGWTSAMA
ncbi:MAG: hypothetical protein WKF47_12880 [Geodermatophilaceae bacterium]